MDDKDKIRQMRDRGGRADIGTAEDGAILEKFNLNETLINIKEHSIRVFMSMHPFAR